MTVIRATVTGDSSPALSLGFSLLWGLCIVVGVKRVAAGARWPQTLGAFTAAGVLAALVIPTLGSPPAYLMPFVATVTLCTLVLPVASAITIIALVTVTGTLMQLPHAAVPPPPQNLAMLSLALPAVGLFAFGQLLRTSLLARRRAESMAQRLTVLNERLHRQLDVSEQLAAERERSRIARELHDSLGHCLTTSHIQLQVARFATETDDPTALRALDRVRTSIESGLQELRRCVSVLRDDGARPELEHSFRELLDRFPPSTFSVDLSVAGTERPLEATTEFTLFRTLQEAMTNAAKHASARHVTIRLDYRDDAVHLVVQDDGVGADRLRLGHGLSGLTERLALVGGTLNIETAHGRGFRLEATVT